MHTEIYESDPFTAQKSALLAALDSDYRFERNDELFLSLGGRRAKVRIIHVVIDLSGQAPKRELLVMKL